MQNNIDSGQITLIHVAKGQLGLTDPQYRDLLSGFNNSAGDRCYSCKELSYDQANTLLEIFEKMGFVPKKKNEDFDLEEFIGQKIPAGRAASFASVKQIDLICRLWNKKSSEKTYSSLLNYIRRIEKVDSIVWLKKKHAQAMILAVKNLAGPPSSASGRTTEDANV